MGFRQRWTLVHSALSKLPQPVSPEEAQRTWDYVWKLCRDAAAGPPTSAYLPYHELMDRQDMLTWENRDEPPPLLQPEPPVETEQAPRVRADHTAIPGATLETTVVQETDGALLTLCGTHTAYATPSGTKLSHRDIWPPGGHTFPDDPTALPGIREPPEEGIRGDPMERAGRPQPFREQEVTPYKVNQVWETLRWLSRVFGFLDVIEFHRLKTKKKAMEEELADTTIKPQRKATVPSKEVIWKWFGPLRKEQPAWTSQTWRLQVLLALRPLWLDTLMMDAFILGIARFQVGCSARFNDLQHVHPKNVAQTSTTVELQAWQTKTVSTSKIRKQPVPLICPKYSVTGKPWWLPFLALVRKMVSLKQFENMGLPDSQGVAGDHCETQHTEPSVELAKLGTPQARSGEVSHWPPHLAFLQGLHPGLCIPTSHPQGPTTIPGQMAHREQHCRSLHEGEEKRGGGHLVEAQSR